MDVLKKHSYFVACLLRREKMTVHAGRKWAIEKDSSQGGRRKRDTGHPAGKSH